MYNYIAIARNGAGIIAKGDRVTFQSERQVEESTGLSFRKEIAEACRQQLHADIDPSQEATNATNFDVYSESRYAEVREKLEAAAARDAAAEERRRKAEEREQAKAERDAAKGSKDAAGKDNGRIGQHGDAIRPKKKQTSAKKKPISLGPLGKIKLKGLLKFLVAAVAIIWFVSTNLKSCSLDSILKEFGVKTEQTTTKKKTTTTKKKSTTSTATKKSSTSAKKSTTTSTAKKKTTTSKSTSTAKKKSTSTAKKKSTSTKRKSTK